MELTLKENGESCVIKNKIFSSRKEGTRGTVRRTGEKMKRRSRETKERKKIQKYTCQNKTDFRKSE
jgi:hypothetical protein